MDAIQRGGLGVVRCKLGAAFFLSLIIWKLLHFTKRYYEILHLIYVHKYILVYVTATIVALFEKIYLIS